MTKEQFDSCKITPHRRDGNTTRIIDALVQQLFTEGKVEYWDHADRLGNRALEHMLNRFQSRLYYEHGLKQNDGYTLNKRERLITLKHK